GLGDRDAPPRRHRRGRRQRRAVAHRCRQGARHARRDERPVAGDVGRTPRTADRLTGSPRPLRIAALVLVVVLVVAAIAALDLLSWGPRPAADSTVAPSA